MRNDERHDASRDTAKDDSARPPDPDGESALVAEQLARMPSFMARGVLYLITAATVGFLLFTVIARIDRVAVCRSVACPSTDIMRVVADRSGYIDHIFIAEGDSVYPGDPLFRIRSKETAGYISRSDDLRERLPLTERNYDLKIAVLRDRRSQRVEKHEKAVKISAIKLEQSELNLSSLESELLYWQNERARLTDEAERVKTGRERGYASLPEYNRALSQLELARSEEKKIALRKEIALREQDVLSEERRQEQLDFENELSQLNKEAENLELEKKSALQTMRSELTLNRELLDIQKSDSPSFPDEPEGGTVIRADIPGVVSEVRFRNPGEYVAVSDLLCTLTPTGSPLYVDITVDNRDIGFVEEGMTVKYKFDAFPYSDYGLLTGTVVFVASSAVEDPLRGFVYHVRGSLHRPFFTIRNREYPIRAGMTATAEMVTERVTVFSLLFRKLKK